MTRGVRLYLVGSFVLVSLAGCGRGFFQSAEREPWRAEAEVACLKSGAVKETADLVRINVGWRPTTLDTYPLLGRSSIANLIVLQQANKKVRVTFWEFTRVGIIVTLVTTLAAIILLALEYRLFPGV